MGKNTRSASTTTGRQEDVDAKMADLEIKFQQGLRDLRSEYQLSKSGDAEVNKDSFETRLRTFESQITKSLDLIKAEIREVKAILEGNKMKEETKLRINNFNKLIIRQLPERGNSNLIEEVCALISQKVKVNISKNDINSCYRVGKSDNNPKAGAKKCRPVVVHFATQWKRDEVFYSKKNLKGSGYLICEVLTKNRYSLLLTARRLLDGKNIWTTKGNIYIFHNNRKTVINGEEDLSSVLVKNS